MEKENWIHVEQALPEMNVPVLAVWQGYKENRHLGIFVRCSDDNGGWTWGQCTGSSSHDEFGDWLQDDDYQISHWQALPSLPDLT